MFRRALISGLTILFIAAIVLAGFIAKAQEKPKTAEPELIIVKYGSVEIKSSLPGAKVYIDDVYKGDADILIENVTTGQHTISCKSGDKKLSGAFTVKKNETLKLEARFDQGKMVDVTDIEKAEAEKKRKAEAAKQEEPKKPVQEKKREEQASPADERRRLHLNIMKAYFEDKGLKEIAVSHKANPQVIAKYFEKKNVIGTLQRNKQNILMCGAGPCRQDWSASFVYTDENGNSDSFVVIWRETFFENITLEGLSKSELEWCLNGKCDNLGEITAAAAAKTKKEAAMERYMLTWTKSSIIISRKDIWKEVLDAGGNPAEY